MDIQRIKDAVQSATAAPLHQKLRDAIQAQIVDATLKPGETLPSERAMKDHFGVSRATVRQAVNALIQDGFLQSIAGTGTFVLEQPVQSSTIGLIGLITSSPNFNFFYPQLTAAFSQRIRGAGYGLVMSLHDESADLLDQMVNELLEQNVVALAITPPRHGDMGPALARLRRARIPVVLIGRNVSDVSNDIVTTDNIDIGYRATRHLIDLGHEHIAYIGLMDYSTGEERALGYRKALQEFDLPPYIYQLKEDPGVASANNGTAPREHLADPAKTAAYQIWSRRDTELPQPTAAFCFNDIVAMGVYKALRDLHRRIPDDVSLISVDNLITIRHFEVPLSTFALPGEAIGTHSAGILLRRLSGDTARVEKTLLPADFIERSSIAPAIRHRPE